MSEETEKIVLATAFAPVLIGVVILASETASTVVAASSGRLARHLSNEWLIAFGFACYAVVDAAVSERVTTEYMAGAMSLRNSTTFLGRTTGPVVFVGLAVSAGFGYESLLLASSFVAIVVTGVVVIAGPVRLARRKAHPASM